MLYDLTDLASNSSKRALDIKAPMFRIQMEGSD